MRYFRLLLGLAFLLAALAPLLAALAVVRLLFWPILALLPASLAVVRLLNPTVFSRYFRLLLGLGGIGQLLTGEVLVWPILAYLLAVLEVVRLLNRTVFDPDWRAARRRAACLVDWDRVDTNR
jgi:hypothetical protein